MKMRTMISLLLAGTLTGCGFTTVDEGERGVMVNMGKMDKTIVTPGFHTFNPFFSDIVVYDIRQQEKDSVTSPLTKDQQDIAIAYSVWYTIPADNVQLLYSRYQLRTDVFETLVRPQVEEAFRDVIAKYKAEEVIANVDTVKNQVVSNVRDGLKGVLEVRDIPIRDINLPKSLSDAIAVKQVEEQKALAKRYELEKEKREAEITITRAEADAKALRLKSEALRTSPELIRFEWVKKWDGKLPQTVLGSNTSYMMTGH